jgi:hypothetical protein
MTRRVKSVLTTAYRPGIRLSVAGTREKVSLPLEFCVQDNGPGVPADLVSHHVSTRSSPPRPTDPDWVLPWSRKLSATTAASSNAIARADKTTFRILMPGFARRPATKAAVVCRCQRARRKGLNRWAKRTILVADDDAAIRTVLNQALSRAGYDVR